MQMHRPYKPKHWGCGRVVIQLNYLVSLLLLELRTAEETLARLVGRRMWMRIWSAGLSFESSCAWRRCSCLRMPKAFCSPEGTSVILMKGRISCHLLCWDLT